MRCPFAVRAPPDRDAQGRDHDGGVDQSVAEHAGAEEPVARAVAPTAVPQASDGEIGGETSQTYPDNARDKDLQVVVRNRLDGVDDAVRLLTQAQRRCCRKGCYQQINEPARGEADPRDDRQCYIPRL